QLNVIRLKLANSGGQEFLCVSPYTISQCDVKASRVFGKGVTKSVKTTKTTKLGVARTLLRHRSNSIQHSALTRVPLRGSKLEV
ncbi:MAG TPA: hypothetical protein VIV66_04400, partial [Pyrinomonadaceae bacterium]